MTERFGKLVVVSLLLPCIVHSFVTRTHSFGKSVQRTQRYATLDERPDTSTQADEGLPTPKVPSQAWRWPGAWPFPDDFLDLETTAEPGPNEYLPESSSEILRSHLRKFIGKDDKVLEIGCAFGKILPADFGSSVEYVELDNGDLDDTLNQYAPALFDKVVVSMGVEYISEPRETFQDVWRVLKPEGQCFVSFKSARVPSVLPPIKMWTEMNDEQKIWIAGSYMHYAGSQFGFKNIEGYDILGSTGQKAMEFTKGEPGETLFVVHGTRAGLPVLDPSNFTSVREYCVSTLRGVRNLKLDDQEFMGLRMAGEYMRAETDEDKNAVLSSAGRLSQIYSVLKDVKEVVIPAPVKAMLATWLLPKWKNTGVQLLALKRGLGLDTSDPDFWPVLGRITAPMEPKDKIALLADVIAAFGEQKNVEQIPQLLEQVTEAIQANMSAEFDVKVVMAVAADLCVSDFLFDTSARSVQEKGDRVMRFAKSLKEKDVNRLADESRVKMLEGSSK